MLNKLRKQCEYLKNINEEKYTLISNILKNNNCFFNIDIETSYNILYDLGYNKEDATRVYLKLINEDKFER